MVYAKDDLLWLDGDAEDANVPDKDSDIKPRHYDQESHGYAHEGGPLTDERHVGAYGDELVGDDDEDEDDYDGDDFDDEMSTEWNLRKCAAAALDVLAVRFGPDLLNVLLAPLKDKLWSSDWLQRESGILALGAMAEGMCSCLLYERPLEYYSRSSAGCKDAIEPHLPALVPYLINMLSDPK